MRKTRLFLLMASMLLCSVATSAYDFEVDGIYYSITSSTEFTVEVANVSLFVDDGPYLDEGFGEDFLSEVVVYSDDNGTLEIPSTITYNSKTYRVTSIGNSAFVGCRYLASVTIPESITSIGANAFDGCNRLTSITSKAATSPTVGQSAFYDVDKSIPVYVPVSSVDTYKAADGWKEFTNIQPSGTCGNNLVWKLTDEGELIIEGTGTMADYSPRQSPWYANRTSIKEISMSSGITSVGNYAFYGLTGLLSVDFSDDVSLIGDYAFYGCGKLTSIELPTKLTAINSCAFSKCSSVTSVAIPDGVTSISSCAFGQCTALTTVSFPENLVSIDEMAFYLCESIESLVIPSKVEIIGRQAFNGCSKLASVTLPDKLNSIPDYAFSDCVSLPSIIIPASVKSIGDCVFSGCENLTSMIVVAGNQTYDSRDNCNAIIETSSNTLISGSSSTIIPNTVTSIGEHAFYGHTKLTSIVIPQSVTSIGNAAFAYCTGLTSITCEAATPPIIEYTSIYSFKDVDTSIPVYVPAASVSAYQSAEYWKRFTNIRPFGTCGNNLIWKLTDEGELIIEGTGTMADYSPDQAPWFENRTSIKEISMSSGITSVGDYAFYGLTELLSVELSRDITSIGIYAFYFCEKLTDIELPTKLTAIKTRAFSNCSSIVSVVIPDGVTSISSCAFQECTALTTVSFPESLVGIDEMAFYLCESIESLVIPSNVKGIGRQAFADCSKMASIVLPEKLNSIPAYAFFRCESLSSIIIPASVKSIGDCAFSGCENLTSIIVATGNQTYDSRDNCNAIIETSSNTLISGSSATIIPNTVTSIGEYAFDGHTKLTSIVIPQSVISIKDGAFSHCSGLITITCEAETPPTIEFTSNYTFESVNTSIPVYVPKSSVEAYKSTEYWKLFTNIQPILKTFSITDPYTQGDFTQTEDEYFDEITYNRTLPNLHWNPLYVPFEIPMTAEFLANYDVVYFNDIHSYDEYIGDKENGILGADGEIDRMSMEVLMVQEGATLNANYPYLIRAKNEAAKALNITVTDATLYETIETTISCSSVFMDFEVTGSYNTLTSDYLDEDYRVIISTGSWGILSSTSKLRPFRIYLKMTTRGGSPVKVNSNAMRTISIQVGNEDGTTSIENKQLIVGNSASGIVYDLQGRRVENPSKGIYIVNGKKTVFK